MIKGFRFTNQLSNAEVDARIHQEIFNKTDGIFYGMELSYTNNSITVSEGLCEIAGRPVGIVGSETVEVAPGNLYCLLILEIDLSKESTKEIFNQVSFKLLTSSTSYPNLTQQDINRLDGENKIYQLEFARFLTTTAGINSATFKDTRKFLNFENIYDEIRQHIQDIDNGTLYVQKADIAVIKAEVTTPEPTELYTIGSSIVHYPDGFNRNNCVIVSLMSENSEGINPKYTSTITKSAPYITCSYGLFASLQDSNIIISREKMDRTEKSTTSICTVVLMKFEDVGG